jgi:hypothetical protein
MARLNILKKTARISVAKQVAARATRAARAARLSGVPVRLAEEFEVWKLLPKAIEIPQARLSKVAEKTGYWQHLIRHGKVAREIVTTRADAAGRKFQVHALGNELLAEKYDSAIQWLDANDSSDAIVRVLVVPTFVLHAFWLFSSKEDRVVLVDAMKPVEGIAPEREYSSQEFLGAIVKQHIKQKLPSEKELEKAARKIRLGNPFNL